MGRRARGMVQSRLTLSGKICSKRKILQLQWLSCKRERVWALHWLCIPGILNLEDEFPVHLDLKDRTCIRRVRVLCRTDSTLKEWMPDPTHFKSHCRVSDLKEAWVRSACWFREPPKRQQLGPHWGDTNADSSHSGSPFTVKTLCCQVTLWCPSSSRSVLWAHLPTSRPSKVQEAQCHEVWCRDLACSLEGQHQHCHLTSPAASCLESSPTHQGADTRLQAPSTVINHFRAKAHPLWGSTNCKPLPVTSGPNPTHRQSGSHVEPGLALSTRTSK